MAFDFSNAEEIARSWQYLDDKNPPPKTAIGAHEAIENGLLPDALNRFRTAVDGLSDKTWAEILAVSLTQLKRLRAGKAALSADVGSQLFLFALILTRAEDVFGSREAALDWLQKPQPLLEGRRPIELLDTFVGAASLDRTLRQIDYGVYL
ncbi:MAG: antitoxin Xre/MbcA/ParS toxin-binding domain-containing protein [Pseudomonadota bacterium]